jgi:large subunit ribosomal protein L9
MKVILRGDIKSVGRLGEIKSVADGFARNYLLPRELVWEATPGNMKRWEKEKSKFEKEQEKQLAAAKILSEQIEKTAVTLSVNVGENGKLFGAVTSLDIVKAFAEKGVKVLKQDVVMEPIREVGAYTVEIRLHHDITAKPKVWIVSKKDKNKHETAETEETEEAAK